MKMKMKNDEIIAELEKMKAEIVDLRNQSIDQVTRDDVYKMLEHITKEAGIGFTNCLRNFLALPQLMRHNLDLDPKSQEEEKPE